MGHRGCASLRCSNRFQRHAADDTELDSADLPAGFAGIPLPHLQCAYLQAATLRGFLRPAQWDAELCRSPRVGFSADFGYLQRNRYVFDPHAREEKSRSNQTDYCPTPKVFGYEFRATHLLYGCRYTPSAGVRRARRRDSCRRLDCIGSSGKEMHGPGDSAEWPATGGFPLADPCARTRTPETRARYDKQAQQAAGHLLYRIPKPSPHRGWPWQPKHFGKHSGKMPTSPSIQLAA